MINKILDLYVWIMKLMGFKIIHFIHIRKTAGTAIRHSFAAKARLNGRFFLSYPYLFIMHGHEFNLSNVGKGEFVFFVVRDPIKRFISGFYSRLREGRPKNYNPHSESEKKCFENFKSPNELASALSSSNQDIKALAVSSMENVNHINTKYYDWFVNENFVRNNQEKLFYVFNQSKLSTEFTEFQNKIGLKLPPLSMDPVISHKNSEKFDKYLSDNSLIELRKWYKDDYSFLFLLKELGHNIIIS